MPKPSDTAQPGTGQPDATLSETGQLAEAVAAAVRGNPAVADLDGGPFGAIACYLPGRRVVGVRVGEPNEPVEVSVVARLGIPGLTLPQLATELRQAISAVTGPRAIHLTINDVITGDPSPEPGCSVHLNREVPR